MLHESAAKIYVKTPKNHSRIEKGKTYKLLLKRHVITYEYRIYKMCAQRQERISCGMRRLNHHSHKALREELYNQEVFSEWTIKYAIDIIGRFRRQKDIITYNLLTELL